MAEHLEEKPSLMEQIKDKIHAHDSSSSSDSDFEKESKEKLAAAAAPAAAASTKGKMYRIFGREKPVHQVLGGGKPADVFLWRNKKISAMVLGGVTAIWVLFEILEYNLLPLVSQCLILSLAILFLWSNAMTFINKSPPQIPEMNIPEDLAVNVMLSLRYDINRALSALRVIASGRNLRKFLAVVAGLWVLSILGSCCDFLTLFYIVFVLLHTVPVLYEKYDDKVDSFAEKAAAELKQQYTLFDAKILRYQGVHSKTRSTDKVGISMVVADSGGYYWKVFFFMMD